MSSTQQECPIRLLPQEREGRCRFDGPFVATRNASNKFGDGVILAALGVVKARVAAEGGLDYFQVLDIGGERLWLIDDASVVTALLPDDY